MKIDLTGSRTSTDAAARRVSASRFKSVRGREIVLLPGAILIASGISIGISPQSWPLILGLALAAFGIAFLALGLAVASWTERLQKSIREFESKVQIQGLLIRAGEQSGAGGDDKKVTFH